MDVLSDNSLTGWHCVERRESTPVRIDLPGDPQHAASGFGFQWWAATANLQNTDSSPE